MGLSAVSDSETAITPNGDGAVTARRSLAIASTERTEFSVALDCVKNGCPEPHRDNGVVSAFFAATLDDLLRDYGQEPKINDHAATVVWRTVPAFVVYDGPSSGRSGGQR